MVWMIVIIALVAWLVVGAAAAFAVGGAFNGKDRIVEQPPMPQPRQSADRVPTEFVRR